MADQQQVLLIEDTPSHQKLYSLWLRIGGYRTSVLADERMALENAARLQPDLIIVDIRLPHISGLDIIEALKAQEATRHIPILALTVLDSRQDKQACYDAGADAFASKSIQIQPFLAIVGKQGDARRSYGSQDAG